MVSWLKLPPGEDGPVFTNQPGSSGGCSVRADSTFGYRPTGHWAEDQDFGVQYRARLSQDRPCLRHHGEGGAASQILCPPNTILEGAQRVDLNAAGELWE